MCFTDNDKVLPTSSISGISLKAAKSALFSALKINQTSTKETSNTQKVQSKSKTPAAAECFKVARRRIYAKLNLSFFVPHTFLGGIFKCTPNKSGFCSPNNYTNVGAIIAEDPRKYWYGFERKPSVLIHHNLFLRTASPWEMNMVYNKVFNGPWNKQIDVDENYDFSGKDLDVIGKAVAKTLDVAGKAGNLVGKTMGVNLDSIDLKLLQELQLLWEKLPI